MMSVPSLSLVVAMAENGVIGQGNRLPWHLPADLAHFKSVTMSKPILMGRKTYESIGKPLPGRRNLVLTRDAGFSAPGIETFVSLDAALAALADVPEVMVIGGAEIYRLCLPQARRIYLTRVHAAIAGDTRFPHYDQDEWTGVSLERREADERNAYAMSFIVLDRK